MAFSAYACDLETPEAVAQALQYLDLCRGDQENLADFVTDDFCNSDSLLSDGNKLDSCTNEYSIIIHLRVR